MLGAVLPLPAAGQRVRAGEGPRGPRPSPVFSLYCQAAGLPGVRATTPTLHRWERQHRAPGVTGVSPRRAGTPFLHLGVLHRRGATGGALPPQGATSCPRATATRPSGCRGTASSPAQQGAAQATRPWPAARAAASAAVACRDPALAALLRSSPVLGGHHRLTWHQPHGTPNGQPQARRPRREIRASPWKRRRRSRRHSPRARPAIRAVIPRVAVSPNAPRPASARCHRAGTGRARPRRPPSPPPQRATQPAPAAVTQFPVHRRSRPRRERRPRPRISQRGEDAARIVPHARWPPQPATASRPRRERLFPHRASPAFAHRTGVTTSSRQPDLTAAAGRTSRSPSTSTDKKSLTRCIDAVCCVISCARRRPSAAGPPTSHPAPPT